jgi:hypothetical protein
MAELTLYVCWSPGYPRGHVHADDSWRARKAYAARHQLATVDVIARRADLVDDKFDRLTLAEVTDWLSDDELERVLTERTDT